MDKAFEQRIEQALKERERAGTLRNLPQVSFHDSYLMIAGRTHLDLSSNDYLGIARERKYWQDFLSYERTLSSGSTGSRLLTGNHEAFGAVEALLASYYNQVLGAGALKRACLYLSSGFEANSGILPTLFGKNDLLLVDKLAHASIIDGMMQGKAKALRYRHNDMAHLASLLEAHSSSYESVCIVTESVFSMDGDLGKLKEIVALKHRHPNVLIYVDEAHSFGLLGAGGLGLCVEQGVLPEIDFIMGTFSKAIGSYGAFFLCAPQVKEYLVNFMRPFIFSTALPSVNVAFTKYIIELLDKQDLSLKREHLKKLTLCLHEKLSDLGLKPSQSQIQPLITGTNEQAKEAYFALREAGLIALPIRYPTVPQGQARVRLALNASLSFDDVARLIQVIAQHRKLWE